MRIAGAGSETASGGPPTRETSRLRLRAPRPSDVDALFEIQSDRDAMQYTTWAPSREATARVLDRYAARFAIDGFAPWTAVLKSEGRIVGFGGLNCDPDAPHWGVEVSYFLHRDYWGRGLAGELVRAALDLAFDELGLERVSAFTRPENRASARVLERAGFRKLAYVPELSRDHYVRGADPASRGAPSPGSLGARDPRA